MWRARRKTNGSSLLLSGLKPVARSWDENSKGETKRALQVWAHKVSVRALSPIHNQTHVLFPTPVNAWAQCLLKEARHRNAGNRLAPTRQAHATQTRTCSVQATHLDKTLIHHRKLQLHGLANSLTYLSNSNPVRTSWQKDKSSLQRVSKLIFPSTCPMVQRIHSILMLSSGWWIVRATTRSHNHVAVLQNSSRNPKTERFSLWLPFKTGKGIATELKNRHTQLPSDVQTPRANPSCSRLRILGHLRAAAGQAQNRHPEAGDALQLRGDVAGLMAASDFFVPRCWGAGRRTHTLLDPLFRHRPKWDSRETKKPTGRPTSWWIPVPNKTRNHDPNELRFPGRLPNQQQNKVPAKKVAWCICFCGGPRVPLQGIQALNPKHCSRGTAYASSSTCSWVKYQQSEFVRPYRAVP